MLADLTSTLFFARGDFQIPVMQIFCSSYMNDPQNFRVSTPPGKSWRMSLVLESPWR